MPMAKHFEEGRREEGREGKRGGGRVERRGSEHEGTSTVSSVL